MLYFFSNSSNLHFISFTLGCIAMKSIRRKLVAINVAWPVVCLRVCLSVTSGCCANTVEPIEVPFTM